jgi:hypothetical protein
MVGLLDHLGIEQADVFGFSLGGLTTYQLLIEHPDRVRRADFILVPNAAEAADLLPRSQLAVLPGTTHIGLIRSEILVPVLEGFLGEP